MMWISDGSQAGLLMTSQTALDQSMFGELGLSHSLKPDLRRKRHSSEETQRHSLPEMSCGGDSKEGRHSCTAAINGHITEDEETNDADVKTPSAPLDLSAFDVKKPELTAQDCQIKVEDALNQDIEALQTALSGLSMSTDTEDGKLAPTLSPSHSIRTPVTENDPLGLFNPNPVPLVSSTTSSPSKKTNIAGVDALLGLSNPDITPARTSNLLVDVEPFSNSNPTSLSKTSLESQGKSESQTSVTSDTSSPASPEKWSPLSQSQPATSQESFTSQDTTSTSSASSQASSTRKGKTVSRSESLSSALKSAASFATKAFSSRFTMHPSNGHHKSNRSSVSSESSRRSSASSVPDAPPAQTPQEKVIEEDEGESYLPTTEIAPIQAPEAPSQPDPNLAATPKALHSSQDLLDVKTNAKYSSPFGKSPSFLPAPLTLLGVLTFTRLCAI